MLNSEGQQHESQSLKTQVYSTLSALLYKSAKLQQRNYCSNVCQIITPLICIGFTLIAQLISNEIVAGKITSFDFPMPLDLPYVHSLAPTLGLSCSEHYIFECQSRNDREMAQALLDKTLKYHCEGSQTLMPVFSESQNSDSYLMDRLKVADLEGFERGNDLKTDLPDGKVYFNSISSGTLNVTYSINDWRLPQYHKNNGVTKILLKTKSSQQISSYLRVTEGMMGVVEKINRAFLQLNSPREVLMGSIMYMPFDGEDRSLKDKIINILGAGLYPLGLSLLLPIFLFSVVSEKEDRLIEIMKMNGLRARLYWVSNFLYNFSVCLLTMALFYGFGRYCLQLTLFVQTSFWVFGTLLVGWSIALVAMTNLVQVFINSAKSATIVGYLLSIFSCFVGEAITTFIYAYPEKVPMALLMFPPFALCRGIYLIGYNCASNSSCYKGLTQTEPEFNSILLILYCWFLVYLLSIWLNDVVQQQYGVARCPHWLESLLNRSSNRPQSQLQIEETVEYAEVQLTQAGKSASLSQIGPQAEDSVRRSQADGSVQNLIGEVAQMPINRKPMIIKGLCKKYPKPSGQDEDYVALKPLHLYLEEKQIFGLLGPNGAGKTTMISVLTGMYPQTSGAAWINGRAVGSASTNKFIGVCPQFDLLWPDLTVYEHLKFYSKLKGVQAESIDPEIQSLLRDVDLESWKSTLSSQLSGGMQRRLSLAISLVGSPKVVFLDEPSSGLDPSHRRQMWNILLNCKKRASILLTTHLMEEAEVLCDRVGIIHRGELKCLGNIDQLKEKFGRGYRLTVSYSGVLKDTIIGKQSRTDSQERERAIIESSPEDSHLKGSDMQCPSDSAQESESGLNLRPEVVEKILRKWGAEIVNELNTRVVLKINKSDILACIDELKSADHIHWLVSQPSLYDVFVHFVK